ncbi:MAG: cupin domain-containing protein [Fibrobacter sp.]|nr:cupin domain-containing protein [Fibrobacter sp.]
MSEEKQTGTGLVGQPFNYAQLVSYQEGSIVSRTIIDKPEGTVTVFAFDAGQRLSTHSAPFDALVEVVDGSGVITIEDKTFEIQSGSQIIMPANKPHAVKAEVRFKMVLIMIKSK